MNNIGFKKVESNSAIEYSPESLFRDLRNRDPQIKHLWSHQADILRQYQEKYSDSSDISLELPTGAGKTLIGLLLGLYRMKKNGEKVLYLCPTRQLAYQVYSHSKKYGIMSHVFVGKQTEYPRKKFGEYLTSEAIAITTYSGLFNINPRFNDPDIIIFDDAHASEGYIASNWSLEINRFKNKDIYFKIVSLFEDKIPKYLMRTIEKDDPGIRDYKSVDMIPSPYYLERIESIREILEENLEEGSNLFFQWKSLQRNLECCNIFLSWYEILIRPWIPPTLSHNPFANAKQRVYMSATLGSGGELERIIGVPKISRLPIPSGWDKQGSGRRFFIFPDYSFNPNEYLPWLLSEIGKFDRNLVLCPNTQSLLEFEKIIQNHLPIKIPVETNETYFKNFSSDGNRIDYIGNHPYLFALQKSIKKMNYESLRNIIKPQNNGKINLQDYYCVIDLVDCINEETGELIQTKELSILGTQNILCRKDEILISGLQPQKGKILIVNDSTQGCIASSEFFPFKIISNKVLPEYLKIILRSNIVSKQWEYQLTGCTPSRARIGVKNILDTIIPIIDNQEKFVSEINNTIKNIVKFRNQSNLLKENAKKDYVINIIGEKKWNQIYDTLLKNLNV